MGLLSIIQKHRWNRKIKRLRAGGAEIGKNIAWFSNDIVVDESRPYLLHIGDYCKVTKGCVILTHDYSLSVMRRVYGVWIGEGQSTFIGDNCFIGMNSIVLMGSHIGNNCIVGAGSIVHGYFPDNVVIAGSPARVICTLQEHYEKRLKATAFEAKECALQFKRRLKSDPSPKDLIAFRFLFSPRTEEALREYNINKFGCNGDEVDEVREAFFKTEPLWPDFKTFLEDAYKSDDLHDRK